MLSKAFAPQTKPWITVARALGMVLHGLAKQATGNVQVCTLGERWAGVLQHRDPRGCTGSEGRRWLGDGMKESSIRGVDGIVGIQMDMS